MKRWVAFGWINSAAFAGSAYTLVHFETYHEALVPLLLDAGNVLVGWLIFWMAQDVIE